MPIRCIKLKEQSTDFFIALGKEDVVDGCSEANQTMSPNAKYSFPPR